MRQRPMTKRANKADLLIYKALQKAIAEDKIHLCLITSKINIPGSPIYNPWENLLPVLLPVLVGLILIWAAGILTGIVLMTAGVFLTSNLIKKKLEHRLLNRALQEVNSDYQKFCELWDFGGLVFVKTDDKQRGCISPDGDWKEFVVMYFADLMVDKKPEEQVQEEKSDEKAA